MLYILLIMIAVCALLLFVRLPQRMEGAERSDQNTRARRSFLTESSAMTVGQVVGSVRQKIETGYAAVQNKSVKRSTIPLVPAGGQSLADYVSLCNACQACVGTCPQGILSPQISMDHMMVPFITFDHGYCPPECVRCTEACPTGALQTLTPEDKTDIQIGTAEWIRTNCLNCDGSGYECRACERRCPTGAIQMVKYRRYFYPFINSAKCIGCGACVVACNATPKAIYVQGYSDHRKVGE